nr:MAG TPA: Thioredoxin-like domain [Caudoviricetes sp.]
MRYATRCSTCTIINKSVAKIDLVKSYHIFRQSAIKSFQTAASQIPSCFIFLDFL